MLLPVTAIPFWVYTNNGVQTCILWFQNFLDATRKHYSAELESVDFIKKLEAAVLKINTWVEEQTQGTWYLESSVNCLHLFDKTMERRNVPSRRHNSGAVVLQNSRLLNKLFPVSKF